MMNNGLQGKPKRKMKKGDTILILELARGSTKGYSAKAAGVGITTVTRRLKDPEFRALVSHQRRLMLDAAAGILAQSCGKAAKALEKLIDGKKIPPHVKRSAARDILDHAMRLREVMDLEERLQAVEERLRNGEG